MTLTTETHAPKLYVLDTSVLISSPHAICAFDDNIVVVPEPVICEVRSYLKNGTSETRSNARTFGRLLDSLSSQTTDLHAGVNLKNGGVLKVYTGRYCNSAIDAAIAFRDENPVLVTRDPFQRVFANLNGIRAEEFKSEAVDSNPDRAYSGRSIIYVSPGDMERFSETGSLPIPSNRTFFAKDPIGGNTFEAYKLSYNENVILANEMAPENGHLFGRFRGHAIERLNYYTGQPVFGVKHRNIGQRFLLDALLAPAEEIPLVIAIGPAGTGKTFLSLAAALAKTYDAYPDSPEYKRIVLTRPNVKMDNDIGYLKGDELDKVMPSLRGVLDNVENLMSDGSNGRDSVDELIARQILVPQSMAYMRGRSIAKQFIIVDEAQNLTPTQALSMISRSGENTKIVLLGDPDQVDSPFLDRHTNGLVYAADGMRGSKTTCIVTFDAAECTRSELAAEAIARLTPKGVNY